MTEYGQLRGICIALLLGLVLSGCSKENQRADKMSVFLNMQICTEDQVEGRLYKGLLECGQLSVPENPDAPEGQKVLLNIIRLPALSSSPKPDPFFIFTGGPGQAVTELLPAIGSLTRLINQQRDIVLVDQRGTGKSNPLDCVSDESVDYTLDQAASLALQDAMMRECLAGFDADLQFYTTPYGMDDINSVRKALGYNKINLWGASYGTRAALVYARRHPDSVRTLTLDRVAPIGINIPHHALEDSDNALRALFAVCAASESCNARFGNLESKTRRLIADLDTNPRSIEIEHPVTQVPIKIRVSGQMIAGLTRLGLYSRDFGPSIPLMLWGHRSPPL